MSAVPGRTAISYTTQKRDATDDSAFQYGYAEYYAEYQFDALRQRQKAEKAVSVLADYFGGTERAADLNLLDIGCSAGLMTCWYASRFGRVMGVDIDEPAIDYAQRNFAGRNLAFHVADCTDTGFDDATFDVVTCTHIYEHVPDSRKMMREIHRVLKPGGVCFFTAQNRVCLVEPHFFLPFLSMLPKPLAHRYMRITGKGSYYYENLLTLVELRRLVSDFRIVDYTARVIADPEKYHADELIRPGSLQQRLALTVLKVAYFLCPTYVWVLVKE